MSQGWTALSQQRHYFKKALVRFQFFFGLLNKGLALFTEVTKGHLLRLAFCDLHNSAGVLIISHI